MNKRKISLLLVVLVLVTMTMAGCGKPYSNVKLEEYIKVGTYKGLTVKANKVTVTDDDVAKEIQKRLEASSTVEEVKTGVVANGDTVVITYDGKLNGKSFEGGKAEGASLTIGSGQFIDGFESGLVGVAVGNTTILRLKFPDDYTSKELAGKEVEFTVTVDSKQQKVVPALDAEFVKNANGSKSVDEYRETVKAELTKDKEAAELKRQKDDLWNQVISGSEVLKDKDGKELYPQEKVDEIVKKTTEDYKNYAKEFNMDFSVYLKQQMGMDVETFNKQVEEYAKLVVKQEEVLYFIAKAEGIEISTTEYKQFISKILTEHGYTEETFKEITGKSYEKAVGKDNIMREAYQEKVLNFIIKNAVVTE